MKEWLQRVIQFFDELRSLEPGAVVEADCSPPVSRQEILENTADYKWPIPEPLLSFYCSAASQCNFRYTIDDPDLYGGPSIVPYEMISGGIENCEQWGALIYKESKQAGNVWLTSVPFIAVPNGDIIAFDIRETADDPPIVYLDHEGAYHRPLASSFETFLYQWERLCYAGPEIWMLGDFIDVNTGYLNHAIPAADAIRRRLRSPFV